MTNNASESTGGRSKVDRVIDEYGLGEMAVELEDRWLGKGDTEQASTRKLADYFNREVLRSAINQSDTFTLSGDVEELYDALTDDEEAEATLVKSRLEQSGVDIETVMSDFISHQTVYRYLKEQRDVERSEQSTAEKLENATETVQRLRGRTTAVTEQKIQTLENNDILSGGEFSVLNDIQVICENCGRSHDVASFFEQRGCDCESE